MKLNMKNYVSGVDYGEIYRLFTNEDVNHLIINKPDHNDMGSFQKWFEGKLSNCFNDFKVFRNKDGEFVGFAYSYDFNPLDGHTLFSVAVVPKYQNIGVGAILTIDFLCYLFKTYNLRKVYIHIYDFNEHSLSCAKNFGFQKEGELIEYRYYNEKFSNLFIFSTTREQFLNHPIVKKTK